MGGSRSRMHIELNQTRAHTHVIIIVLHIRQRIRYIIVPNQLKKIRV